MIKRTVFFVLALIMILAPTAFASDAWTLDYSTAGGWGTSDASCLELIEDKLPIDSDVTYNGMSSLRVNLTSAGGWWVGFVWLPEKMDLTPYKENGYLQFAVKGESGSEMLNVGFRSYESETEANAISTVSATADWSVVRIPIKDLIDNNPDFVYTKADGFEVRNFSSQQIKVWIADIQIVNESASEPAAEPQEIEETNPKTGDFGMVPYLALAVVSGAAFMKKRVQK